MPSTAPSIRAPMRIRKKDARRERGGETPASSNPGSHASGKINLGALFRLCNQNHLCHLGHRWLDSSVLSVSSVAPKKTARGSHVRSSERNSDYKYLLMHSATCATISGFL